MFKKNIDHIGFVKKFYKIIFDDLFFNSIMSMSIEGFIDFIIFGYLNIKTAEFTMNGEQLGFGLGVFSVSLSGFILPIVIIIIISTKSIS